MNGLTRPWIWMTVLAILLAAAPRSYPAMMIRATSSRVDRSQRRRALRRGARREVVELGPTSRVVFDTIVEKKMRGIAKFFFARRVRIIFIVHRARREIVAHDRVWRARKKHTKTPGNMRLM